MCQRVGDCQASDPRADYEYALDRCRHPTGNIRSSVIENLGSHNTPLG
jgi:hypothetical protein